MEEPPNIAIFVLDSARADFVPSYQGMDTFSSITDWADRRDSVTFSNAHAHSVTSATSMGSLLTGVHPFRHGLRPADRSLPSSLPTVAERLSNVGYETVGVSANVHFSSYTGLDRGFDSFRFISSNIGQLVRSVGIRNLFEFALRLRSESAGLDPTPEKHTVTPLINSLIREEITAGTGNEAPFFLVTQYIEPHSPYYPPRKYLNTEGRRQAEVAYRIHDQMYPIIANHCDLLDEEWRALKQMYALEIKYTASMVRKAIEYIESVTSRNTIYIITADHGDLFGEQNFLFHSRPLHNKLTSVPLTTVGLPVAAESNSSVYCSPVVHADIINTLLEIAQANTSGIDGIDLRMSQRSRFLTQRPYSFNHEILRQHNPEYENKYIHDDPVTAFHIGDYKVKFSSDKTSVYNLSTDPLEEDELSVQDLPENVRQEYNDWHSVCEQSGLLSVVRSEAAEIDDATRKQLENLGYIEDS